MINSCYVVLLTQRFVRIYLLVTIDKVFQIKKANKSRTTKLDYPGRKIISQILNQEWAKNPFLGCSFSLTYPPDIVKWFKVTLINFGSILIVKSYSIISTFNTILEQNILLYQIVSREREKWREKKTCWLNSIEFCNEHQKHFPLSHTITKVFIEFSFVQSSDLLIIVLFKMIKTFYDCKDWASTFLI